MSSETANTLARWRLVLGRFSEKQLPPPASRHEARMEAALDYLYSREYKGRGIRNKSPAGTLDPSQINIPQWLGEVRDLFPKEVVEVIEKHALERYGLTEMVTDREVLERLEPNMDLLKALLAFRDHLKGEVIHVARRIIRQVVEELKRKLEMEVRKAMSGRMHRFRHGSQKAAASFDWRGTFRANLKYYDVNRKQMVVQNPLFFSRNHRLVPWQIILCVDQSGSMADSVIHSAVMAGILAGLPMMQINLVVFDTSIVDMSNLIDDPVEVLMGVQLGGGTDIASAMLYCERLIHNPRRTVVALISDFCEGGSPALLFDSCRRIREAGVKLIGLAALDQEANPSYDKAMAEQLAGAGMDIAALTPGHFAQWLAQIINSR